ncbi:MAG: hypothetical protein EBW78_00345 [Candidatus Fonsibacter ubiquis]|nr:hypothetical protein [Candidatus Fonsibacter ubiquis]
MFKNLLGSWYLKKKISNGFLGEGLVYLKSKKLNNFCFFFLFSIHFSCIWCTSPIHYKLIAY